MDKKESISSSRLEQVAEKTGGITRRDFLKYMSVVSVGAGLTAMGLQDFAEGGGFEKEWPTTPHEGDTYPGEGLVKDTEQAVDATKQEIEHTALDEYWRTVFQQGLMICAKAVATRVFDYLGIPSDSAEYTPDKVDNLLKNKPRFFLKAAEAIVVAPIIEEMIFRYMPSKQLRDQTTVRWGSGIAISALFAMIHTMSLDRKEGEVFGSINYTEAVPITQFMGGLFYWYLMRTRGLSHAMLAHAENNVAVAVAMGLHELFPPKEDNVKPKGRTYTLINQDTLFGLRALKAKWEARRKKVATQDAAGITAVRSQLDRPDK